MIHFVNKRSLFDDYPNNSQEIILGAGCFWGVERVFWQLDGVWVTYASYSGGRRPDPTYEQVCTGVTGHAETINVIYDNEIITTKEILKIFWECHDPTQGMKQGNDIGEQYRSVIYCTNNEQLELTNMTKKLYEKVLVDRGHTAITTEININQSSYPAEEYHQQYLAKNPDGYCGIKGTGCALPPL
ncbi:MAG: peptide-methionine (S)-S-oxide reductase [Woeseiaceae bacterium]|nr:peptide-methionine (S)-S-oxide reductase [Woeseiaceae bacterium]|tara:strand:- start:2195 stop:2752 length:558 start_codon:yes stop_codon:yes gene_type:complete